ncbi:flagellar hook-associated protein FlgK [Hafnia alvei]|uniref:Flagellar hook-associated protein 1 n=1 Tax=Hafnia alvei ATCC 51873 TaxID=1002364 RepID=G9Y5W1_HAFAL|nr:flagellar hook-associated protein FlgK [Hafnia alvei]EHM43473.1 flagellar hook-associated protein FlgK [Hafnia alvei ATCC 51873]QQE45277.1 flagellar hook-associated protein FlgK [Hafnia alvei]
MANLINSAMSGLSAAQTALSVASNNLSNVYTQGYNRQTVSFAQSGGTSTPTGFIGNGVNVSGINREYNSFIVGQLRQGQSDYASTTAYYQQVSQIDNLLADSNNSLSANMQDFFSNLQNLVSNPSDPAARQTVLAKANGLVNQFKTTDEYLKNLESNANVTISNSVEQINNYTKQIASLNDQISRLTGASGGSAPNDLLDLRDQMATQLNQIANVEITMQDGAMNVSFAGGLSLVQGNDAYKLEAIPSSSNPQRLTIGYNRGSGTASEVPEGRITGGSLSGILQFRSGALDNARNQLGQIALSMADSFNKVQQAGIDLNGDLTTNEPFFTIGQPSSFANSNNDKTVNASISAKYTDVSQTKATDYRLEYDKNGKWQITRLSDNSKITDLTPDATGKLQFDGLEVTVSPAAAKSDSFTLKTTSSAVQGFGVAITDAAKIGAGTPEYDASGNLVPDASGKGDNTNAQKMLDLQKTQTVGGKSTFNEAYAGLVGTVGNQTNSAKVDSTAQGNVVKQLTQQQQSVSGVNLDEEYGNLMRFQQYYQANAQVIQTATTLFSALLNIR